MTHCLRVGVGGPVGSIRYEFQGTKLLCRKWLMSHRLSTEYPTFSRKQKTSEPGDGQ